MDVQSKSLLSDLPREACFGGSSLSFEFGRFTHLLFVCDFFVEVQRTKKNVT